MMWFMAAKKQELSISNNITCVGILDYYTTMHTTFDHQSYTVVACPLG